MFYAKIIYTNGQHSYQKEKYGNYIFLANKKSYLSCTTKRGRPLIMKGNLWRKNISMATEDGTLCRLKISIGLSKREMGRVSYQLVCEIQSWYGFEPWCRLKTSHRAPVETRQCWLLTHPISFARRWIPSDWSRGSSLPPPRYKAMHRAKIVLLELAENTLQNVTDVIFWTL